MKNPFRGIPRPPLHELDEAYELKKSVDRWGVEVTAELTATSIPFVRHRIKLLTLAPSVQRAFRAGQIAVSRAFEIAQADPEKQPGILAIATQCSVRKLRMAVRRA